LGPKLRLDSRYLKILHGNEGEQMRNKRKPHIQIKLSILRAAWRAVAYSNTLAEAEVKCTAPRYSQDRRDFICAVTYLWPVFKYKRRKDQ
jgi:hypothetical protein